MADGTLAELHDPTGLPAGVKFDFNPTEKEILEYIKDKETGKLHPLIDKIIPTLEEETDIRHTHPEKLPGVSKDGQIQYFFHRLSKAYLTGTRKRGRVHTNEDGSETRWQETGNAQPILIGGTVKGFKKILVFDAQYECHQYHLGNNKEKEGELVVSKVFYLTQLQRYGSSIKDSIGKKTRASFIRVCWNRIKRSLFTTSNSVAKVISLCNGSELQASEQELPHEPNDANNDSGSCFYGSIADESTPKRRKPSQSKSDDREGSLLSTITTPDHSPTPYQTETGGTKGQGMQAQISFNSGAADMKNAVSRLEMVPSSSLSPAEVQAWGSASCSSLPKPAQPVAFGHMNSASSLGSGNRAGNFPQMGLPAPASCWPNVQQPLGSDLTGEQNAAPRGSNFTGNQNAAPTPVIPNQNPFWGQVPVNPDIGGWAHPGNQNATPRPMNLNQEPNYPRVGIGSVTMNPSVNIHSAGSSTINFNNGNTNNVSAPPCWANYGRGS